MRYRGVGERALSDDRVEVDDPGKSQGQLSAWVPVPASTPGSARSPLVVHGNRRSPLRLPRQNEADRSCCDAP